MLTFAVIKYVREMDSSPVKRVTALGGYLSYLYLGDIFSPVATTWCILTDVAKGNRSLRVGAIEITHMH